MIKCTYCGTSLSDSEKFCHECGNKVEKTVFCTNCGNKIEAGYKFCPLCGTPAQQKGKIKPVPKAKATLENIKKGLLMLELAVRYNGEEAEMAFPYTYKNGTLCGYAMEEMKADPYVDLSELKVKDTYPFTLKDYKDLDEFLDAVIEIVVVQDLVSEFPDGDLTIVDNEVTLTLYDNDRKKIYSYCKIVEVNYETEVDTEEECGVSVENIEGAYMILSFESLYYDEDDDEVRTEVKVPYTFRNGKLYRYAVSDEDEIDADTDVSQFHEYDGVGYDIDNYDDLEELADDIITNEGSEFVSGLEIEDEEVADNAFNLTIYNKKRQKIFSLDSFAF